MIASATPSEGIVAQAGAEASAEHGGEPAPPPLSETNARIEALAAEIRIARGFAPAPDPKPIERTPAPIDPAQIPAAADTAPRLEPRRRGMIPFIAAERRSEASDSASKKDWEPGGLLSFGAGKRLQTGAIAASLTALALVGAAALYERSGQAHILAIQTAENESLATTVKALKTKVDALEAARPRDDAADLRRTIGEMKATLAGSRESNSGLSQLAARFDKSQRDQDARLARLSDKVDHDAASRNADLVARIEKLEKKPAAPVVAALAPPPAPAAVSALPRQPSVLPPPAPASRDVTGSIPKARQPLRDWIVRDVHDGVAMIEGRDGEREVSAGDVIPGAGRVARIERRGRGWAVVTDLGAIVGDAETQF